MAEGIVTRHSRSCAKKRGGERCSCQPSYTPWVFHPGKGGKVYGKATTSQAEAKSWRVDALQAVSRKTLAVPTKQTIKEASEDLLEAMESGQIRNRSGDQYKPSVVRSYQGSLRRYVLPELGQVRLSDLTRNHLQDLVDSLLAEDFNASTVRNAVMPLRVIYRRSIQRGDVAINPTHDLNMPAVRGGRDRIAPPREAAALIAALPTELRAVWSTAFYGGLRKGELRALRWENVNLADGLLRVEAGWDTKEGLILPKSRSGQRRVPIPAGLRDVLTEHRMTTWQDGYVFGRGPEKVFGATSLTDRADRAWRDAGLDRLTLHEARHTYASLMIEAGVNPKALCQFMGHSSIQVTLDRYGHLFPGAESEAASRLDALLANAEGQARSADAEETTGTQSGTHLAPIPSFTPRRGAGAVERGGLENR
jgi:integrase